MHPLPFELRYNLTRRQRLIPHLRIWWRHAPLIIVCVGGAAAGIVYLSWWCIPLLFCLLFIFRGFFIGFLNVVLIRRQAMDLVIEHNSLAFLAGDERWYCSLDGLTAFDELARGVWTLQHWNVKRALASRCVAMFGRRSVVKRSRQNPGCSVCMRQTRNRECTTGS